MDAGANRLLVAISRIGGKVRLNILKGLVATLAFVIMSSSVSAQTNKCRAADAASGRLVNELKDWMTTTDPEKQADRDTAYKIPVVSVSSIALISDERICGKIISAYAAIPGKNYTPANLYVIALGNKYYAVYDPADLAGDFRTIMIFDSRYSIIGGWTG